MSNRQPIQLHLLGSFSITSDKQVLSLRRKTRALLAFLAVTWQAHSRRRLMDLFCQEANAPARALAVLLSRIRKQLGTDILLTDKDTIQLNRALIGVDLTAFQAELTGDLAEKSVVALQTAVSLYRDELLTNLTLNDAPEFELWLLGQRAHARQLLERGLMVLISRLIDQQNYQKALVNALRLVQHTPLLEEAHVQLIWLYAKLGQRKAALQQFEQCKTVLQDALGIAPTDTLQSLIADIRAKRPTIHGQQGETAVALSLSPTPTSFVGRTAEMARLQAAWQAAQAGKGGVYIIGAAAGQGKTRLVQALIDQMQETAVYRGRCFESSRTLPYQPWINILETHLQQLDDATLQTLPPSTKTYMPRLLPQLLRRLADATAADMIGAEAEMDRLFTAVVDFLSHKPAINPTPALIFLDDLQWADETSLHLFHYISQRVPQLPWLLIGTYRPEEVADAPPLAMLLDDFERRTIPKIALNPLTGTDIEALIAHSWTKLPAGYRDHIAAMLFKATGGNALFVTAVLQELVTTDTIPDELPVPATVRDLVNRRLRRLPQASQQVLEALAIFGSPAQLMQLQWVSGRSGDEVAHAMDLGLQSGLLAVNTPVLSLAETAVFPTTYQFHHDLVREAVTETLSVVRVQRLHARTAAWLSRIAERQPGAIQEELAGRIIIHAAKGEAYPLLFRWAPIAAAHARHIFAYRDALDLLEIGMNAFAQCQLDLDFDEATAEITLFEMMMWWLANCDGVGKPISQIEAMVQQAGALFDRHPSPERTATWHLMQAQSAPHHHQTIELAQTAHKHFLQLNQLSMAAASLITCAASHLSLSENKSSQRVYSQALALYQQTNDISGQVQSLTGLGWAALNLGEVEAALTHLTQALTMSRQRGDRIGEAQTRFVLTAAWGFYHASDQMEEMGQAAIEVYEQIGYDARAIRPLMYLGAAQDMRGNVAAALPIYKQVLERAAITQDVWIMGWAAQLAGRIQLERGNPDAAAPLLKQAQQIRITTGELQNQVSDLAWLGRLHLAQGDVATALTATEQAITQLDAFHGEFYVWEQPDVLMCRAEALAAAGNTTAAHNMRHRAHKTLHQFARQITDPTRHTEFMAYRRNARIETAVSTQ
ncbi:MAG: AAA family ATPase [Chloroflexi bacterium]|nr:AAA family ATPase [Chloroflexota bacterium]